MKSLRHKLHLFCWGLAKKNIFFLAQFNNLRLFIVRSLHGYLSLFQDEQNKKCFQLLLRSPRLQTAVFYCTWTLVFDPSTATRRVGWPQVLTTLTQTPTMSCDCFASKGGNTSQQQRYGEWNIKGRQGLMVPVPPTGTTTGFTQPSYKGCWHSLLNKL